MEKYGWRPSSCACAGTTTDARTTRKAIARTIRISQRLAGCSTDRRQESWDSKAPAANVDPETPSTEQVSAAEFRLGCYPSDPCDKPRPTHRHRYSAPRRSSRETASHDLLAGRTTSRPDERAKYHVPQSRSCVARASSHRQTAQTHHSSDPLPQSFRPERETAQPPAVCRGTDTAAHPPALQSPADAQSSPTRHRAAAGPRDTHTVTTP